MDMRELKKLIYSGEKVDVECKKAQNSVPNSVYETYSSFANTKGGIIVLGVDEDKTKLDPEERFSIQGVDDPEKLREDFWNTINSQKVSANILVDDHVYVVEENGISLLVIEVPRADYTFRPIYKGENPFKGTYKRNHEGDYHAKEYEVRAMIRDQSSEGNDNTILEGYTMDDIDSETLQKYRIMFNSWNPQHVWRELPDQEFLEMLGGYRKNRRDRIEGLTIAGLLMFGKGLAIRDEFANIFMDYRNETVTDDETRWVDRVTYDGTWENNLFNFFRKVVPKLTEDLKKPFVLKNMQRIEDTPVHKAIREAFVNMIIHADYRMDAGVLKVIKLKNGFCFSNPGSLKLPKEQIYKGGESKARNPHMQTMLRMVGFGDNAGSGFPDILKVWSDNGWKMPELIENTVMNQVSLTLEYKVDERENIIYKEVPEIAEEVPEIAEEVPEIAEEKSLDGYQLQIYNYVINNGDITTQKAKALLGVKDRRARQILADMCAAEILERIGATSNLKYVLKQKNNV